MKISLNWLKKYVKVPVSDDELVRLIGARLVEVEGVIDETHKYDNIYIVRVESCEKIPETHLTLCQIDYGKSESVQVVCGAPNVREGMLAVWIAPGAVVPASVHEDAPFVIGKRKMQGYESNGMLAGADELDFGDDHSGIVEIEPGTATPGTLLADVFELSDLVLEIENKSLTHRPDCFGMIGFAREVAGILGEPFGDFELSFSDGRPHAWSFLQHFAQSSPRSSRQLAKPAVSLDDFTRLGRGKVGKNDSGSAGILSEKDNIEISIANPEICSRYSAIVLEKHGEFLKKYLTWVDTVLSKSGMKPISPIVDATNFLMLLTGQPLHAFDYDKFVAVGGGKKPEIRVRLAKQGEKLTLLDCVEIELKETDIIICSGEVPVALAGAMGGESTMIDESTRKVILESATFSLYNLRKTQMAHGIFTEAITRFTKGQPPYQTLAVAEECAEILSDGFKVTAVADEYPKPEKEIVVKITTDEINSLLGTDYGGDLIVKALENVGFSIAVSFGDGVAPARRHGRSAPHPSVVTCGSPSGKAIRKTLNLTIEIHVPKWRTDIHIKEDIIEEVGRLLGYDNIKPTLPLHGTANRNSMRELKEQVREVLSKYGANEVLTYSFVNGKLMEKVGQDVKDAYKIVNSISPDLQYVRQSIVPSLLEKAYVNQKLPVEKFAMFEMNEVYRKSWGMNDEEVPVGKVSLGFVLAERKNTETAYYKAKKYVAKLMAELRIEVEFLPIKVKDAEAKPFEPKRSAQIVTKDGGYLGVVGEFKNSVRNEFKLAPYLAGFELVDLGAVLETERFKKQIEVGTKKTEDLTVTTDQTYAEALAGVRKKYPEAEISPLSIYQAPGQKTRNISFRITTLK